MRFSFAPRWIDEELIVSADQGSFRLTMPMGTPSVDVPSESVWEELAPEWAKDLWPVFLAELREWSASVGVLLFIGETASIDGVRARKISW